MFGEILPCHLIGQLATASTVNYLPDESESAITNNQPCFLLSSHFHLFSHSGQTPFLWCIIKSIIHVLIYPHRCASPLPSSNHSVPNLWLMLWALGFSLNPDRQSPSTSTLMRNTLLLCGLDPQQGWEQMSSTGGLIHQLLKPLVANQWAKRTHVGLSAKIRDKIKKINSPMFWSIFSQGEKQEKQNVYSKKHKTV